MVGTTMRSPKPEEHIVRLLFVCLLFVYCLHSSLVLLRSGVIHKERFGGRAESGGLLRWSDALIAVDFLVCTLVNLYI